VYGYWRAFRGKELLFDGYDVKGNCRGKPSRDSDVASVIGEIAKDTKTNYGGEVTGDRFGLTWPRNMPKGAAYGKGVGYSNTKCNRIRGTEFNKFASIRKQLDADKPVILLMRNGKRGIPDHYVVIEAAVKKQKKVLKKWRDREVHYLVNFGEGPYGKGHQWICVRQRGRNTRRIWTAASAFSVSVN